MKFVDNNPLYVLKFSIIIPMQHYDNYEVLCDSVKCETKTDETLFISLENRIIYNYL